MASATMAVVSRCISGGKAIGPPLADLACGVLVPAAVVVDGARAAASVASRVGAWLRKKAAAMLRAVAQTLDPLPVAESPVASPAPVPCFELGADPAPEPVILPMRSAAQVTIAPPPKRTALPADDLRAAIAEHGTVRAAARALGVAESTLRCRCQKAGVVVPGRKSRK